MSEQKRGQDVPDELGTGLLRPDTRRVLVQLVKGPFVSRESSPNLWAALESDEKAVRVGLGNLFLELVLDRDQGLAFARNQTGDDVPKMIRNRPLTLIDTALVLFLRERLLRSEGRAFIGRDEIDDQLQVYGPAAGADAVGLGKRVNASVEKMKKNSVLQATNEEGRFEISPVLRMVFDAEEVSAVTVELASLVRSGEAVAGEDSGDDEEEA